MSRDCTQAALTAWGLSILHSHGRHALALGAGELEVRILSPRPLRIRQMQAFSPTHSLFRYISLSTTVSSIKVIPIVDTL